jgi:AcrR family transcriptional regulator
MLLMRVWFESISGCSFRLSEAVSSLATFYAKQYNNTMLGFVCEMEQKARTRGRPRAYDRDLVLDQAAELFWANGFSATSLDELGATMGMVRPSIYNAFGDKEALFLSALERYQETVGSTPLKAMAGEDSIHAAVAAFFDQVVTYTTADETHRGCLLGSVAAATDSPTIHSYLRANLQRTEEDIARRLQRAVDQGELPHGYSPAEGARLTIDEMLALGTRARIGTPRDELAAHAAAATETVLRQPVDTRSAGD